MRRWTALGIATEVGGIGCLVVAYLNRKPEAEAFTAFDPIEPSAFQPFRGSDPYLWLGAGVALVLVGLAILVVARVTP